MRKPEIITVNCPTCQKAVVWSSESPYRPFCSKRCQLIDLGDWASEENRIPSDEINLEETFLSEQSPTLRLEDDN